jgi:hypothetical protein
MDLKPRLAVMGGAFFVAFPRSHRLCQYDDRGRLQQQFGAGMAGWHDGPAAAARFNMPCGMAAATAAADAVYVADSGNDAVRRINLKSGEVATVARGSSGRAAGGGCPACESLREPVAVARDGENLFIAARTARRILVLDTMGMGRAAGTGRALMADGEMLFASFRAPEALAVAWWGQSVYVLDEGRLRFLDYNLRGVRTVVFPSAWSETRWLAIAAERTRVYVSHRDVPLVGSFDVPRHTHLDIWKTPLSTPASGLTHADGALWALSADGGTVVRHDPATGANRIIELERN